MKAFFRTVHLYLSLAAGLVIFFSCLTGTIMVFEEEIEHALNANIYTATPTGTPLPLSQLVKNAKEKLPDAKMLFVKVYSDPSRTVEIGLLKKKKETKDKPEAEKGTGSPGAKKEKTGKGKKGKKPDVIAYANPYTGEVTLYKENFFFTVEMLHRFLLAGKDSLGNIIAKFSALIFLFILITGVILWWPKTKSIMRQRLKIKWGSNWKRLTHDLHIVTGFYTSLFLIITVLTGLIMSFEWANDALFSLTGSKKEGNFSVPQSVQTANPKKLSIDEAYRTISTTITNAEFYTIRIPGDSTGVYTVTVLPKGAPQNTAGSYYIDQYSGKIAGSEQFADKNTGQQLRSYIKPIHTGAVYGLPTKIISFIVCLLSLTFPVTGVLMWLNRLNIKKKMKQKGRQRLVST